MSPSFKQKKIPAFLVALVLACFAISRGVQAAQPPDIQNVNEFNTPFQRTFFFHLINGELEANSVTIDIPAGKTLVVEYVSAYVELAPGEHPVALYFISSFGAGGVRASLFLNFQASTNNADFFVASQQIRLYVTPGQNLLAHFRRDVDAGFAGITATVIGYLVNTP